MAQPRLPTLIHGSSFSDCLTTRICEGAVLGPEPLTRREIGTLRTILCVDDHPSALQALSMLLQSRGYRSLAAATPEQAVLLLQSNQVDLAIVDHWLPQSTGSVLAQQLKAIRNIPVIMITGDPDLKQAPEYVDLLLGKPQNPEDLLGFVAALLPDR